MRERERAKAELRQMARDLGALFELLGYLALFGAVCHFVQTAPWYDALIGSIFILVMAGRRFRRWRGNDDVERPS